MKYTKEYDQYGAIYSILFPNGKRYIGQTSGSLRYRWHYYKSLNCKKQIKLYRAFKKHGQENCKYEILEYCNSQEELDKKEKDYIQKLDTINNGYNAQTGGNVLKFTPEICRKISETKKERNKGRVHNWQGKHHSEETKQKLKLLVTGRKMPPRSEEYKKAISKRMSGKNHHFYGIPFFQGKKHSESSKNKIRDSHARTYELTSPDGLKITITNLKKFCIENGLNNSLMVAVSKGKRKTHQGWKAVKIKQKETV